MMLQNPPPLPGAGGAGRWCGTSHLGSRLSRPNAGDRKGRNYEGHCPRCSPGSGAYRLAGGAWVQASPAAEHGAQRAQAKERERDSCSNPIPGATAAAAAASASATAGEVT